MFRGNQQNTGFTSQKAHYTQDQPWAYATAKGIFSTAVIDRQGQIYVGSADKRFYALWPEGKLVWQLATGEIIDSSALLSQNPEGKGFITIPSGDGNLYHLDASTKDLAGIDRIEWTFNAADYPHPKAVGYTWFEGNVGIDAQGRLLAGNTNWNFYAIDGNSGELQSTRNFDGSLVKPVIECDFIEPDKATEGGKSSKFNCKPRRNIDGIKKYLIRS